MPEGLQTKGLTRCQDRYVIYCVRMCVVRLFIYLVYFSSCALVGVGSGGWVGKPC